MTAAIATTTTTMAAIATKTVAAIATATNAQSNINLAKTKPAKRTSRADRELESYAYIMIVRRATIKNKL